MLWKYFQNCVDSFRENWEINITICHTVPRFNLQLFTNSLKSKVVFQCCSKIMWPTVLLRGMVSICLLMKGKYDWFLQEGLLLDRLIFLLYLLLKIFCQDNKFFILKSVSWFPTFTCLKASQNFCYCNAI